MNRPSPLAAIALAVAFALAACGSGSSQPPPGGPSGPVNFVIDGRLFHMSSGGYFSTPSGFNLYFTDLPFTCNAVTVVPQAKWIRLELAVTPPANGTGNVVIGSPNPPALPPPGAAAGAFVYSEVDVAVQTLPTKGGSLSWTYNASDRSLTITNLDVAFVGTSDTIATYGLTVPLCNP
jgi:hypothetical protein